MKNQENIPTNYAAVNAVMEKYDVVIGIEVHCQLASHTKVFSRSPNSYGDPPNANIDPTCLGLPGALPTLNEQCVNLALRMGLALGSDIQRVSCFARKNYFYPDLPKGYQITQFDKPICLGGSVTLSNGKNISIERIQIEEDAGKNIHVGAVSLVDYNRSGVGLIEIVSNPDLSSPEEATEYLKKLHSTAVYLNISDGDMEKGNFRADANVSLKPKGSPTLGQRCEIKNVNSFKYLEKAIAYEIERQAQVIDGGGTITMETRGYDSDKNITVAQRTKESAHDYRYFPEPDLPPLIISAERLEKIKSELPELPEAKSKRLVNELGIPAYDADVISKDKRNSSYFEQLIAKLDGAVEAKTVSNFFMTEILRSVKVAGEKAGIAPEDVTEIPVALEHSASLLILQKNGTISGRIAKDVFEEVLETGKAPADIVTEKNLSQISDDDAILKLCEQVIADNPNQLADYLSGKDRLFGFFVGQAMKHSGGRMNPAQVNTVLKDLLSKKSEN